MTFEYEILLPSSIEDERFVGETINSLLAELSITETDISRIELGNNYQELSWRAGKILSNSAELVATKMLPGGGMLCCFNVSGGRPVYQWVTDSDLEPE